MGFLFKSFIQFYMHFLSTSKIISLKCLKFTTIYYAIFFSFIFTSLFQTSYHSNQIDKKCLCFTLIWILIRNSCFYCWKLSVKFGWKQTTLELKAKRSINKIIWKFISIIKISIRVWFWNHLFYLYWSIYDSKRSLFIVKFMPLSRQFDSNKIYFKIILVI